MSPGALSRRAADACDVLAGVAGLTERPLDLSEVAVQALPAPHRQTTSLGGRMAVYSFWLGDQPLKVGIAGPNDEVRFRHQHYSPGAASSTLAKSIRDNPGRVGLDAAPEGLRPWMQAHLGRLNILMPPEWGQGVLHAVEGLLQARWRPVFEGRPWKGFGHEALEIERTACSAGGGRP